MKLASKVKEVKEKDNFIISSIVGRSRQEDAPLIMGDIKKIFEANYIEKLEEAKKRIEELSKWLIDMILWIHPKKVRSSIEYTDFKASATLYLSSANFSNVKQTLNFPLLNWKIKRITGLITFFLFMVDRVNSILYSTPTH